LHPNRSVASCGIKPPGHAISNVWATGGRPLRGTNGPADTDFEAQVKQNWSAEFGDRRQAFGWIGYRLDAASWRRRLQGCLLTTAEVLQGEAAWRGFEDPFARAARHADSFDNMGSE
jgi:hypothetical protein